MDKLRLRAVTRVPLWFFINEFNVPIYVKEIMLTLAKVKASAMAFSLSSAYSSLIFFHSDPVAPSTACSFMASAFSH